MVSIWRANVELTSIQGVVVTFWNGPYEVLWVYVKALEVINNWRGFRVDMKSNVYSVYSLVRSWKMNKILKMLVNSQLKYYHIGVR